MNIEETLVVLTNGKTFPRKTFSEYTKEELIEVIGCCRNYKDIIETLKINSFYHKYLKKFIEDNNVNITHFTKSQRTKSKIQNKLIKGDKHIAGKDIKKYLINNKIITEKCSICNIPPVWNNKPLTLQLDHINGDHFDNRVENLRLLCPNCHTQTDTYTGKNLAKYKTLSCNTCSTKLKPNNITGKCANCINKDKEGGKCSTCKVNDRFHTYMNCKDCIQKQPERKKCKVCDKVIVKSSNKGDYHMRCIKGIEKDNDKDQQQHL